MESLKVEPGRTFAWLKKWYSKVVLGFRGENPGLEKFFDVARAEVKHLAVVKILKSWLTDD